MSKIFLPPKENERGQVFAILALSLVGILAFAALAIDGGIWWSEFARARGAVDNACVAAAKDIWRGEDGSAVFASILTANNFNSETYSPNEYSGDDSLAQNLIKGYAHDSESASLHTAIKYEIDTYILQVVGWRKLPVRASEKCSTTGAFITPVAVKSSAFLDSLNNGTWISVVGQGAEADIDSGENYRGVVFPFIWCVESEGNLTPDTNCPYAYPVYPIEESPPSAATAKNILKDYCWKGYCNRNFPPVGMRLATVPGTSNNQLCKEAVASGLVPGQDFVAIVYDGEVVTPDPGFGNWENVGVLGWGTFTVVELRPGPNNCNELVAVATGGIYSSPNQIPKSLTPREIPWDAIGGW